MSLARVSSLPGAKVVCWRPHLAGMRQYIVATHPLISFVWAQIASKVYLMLLLVVWFVFISYWVYSWYTLPNDQQFNLEFQFKSVFKLEFQAKFGIQLGIPIPLGINLGECSPVGWRLKPVRDSRTFGSPPPMSSRHRNLEPWGGGTRQYMCV